MLVVAVVVVVAVIVEEASHPAVHPPAIGTAISVPGQRVNILPDPDFLTACSATAYDDSSNCVNTTVQAINNARATEGLPSMTLPGNWRQLTPAQQLFVATNLERTARNLGPMSGLTDDLDGVAASAAQAGGDPQLTAGGELSTVAGNWIQGYSNPLEAVYEWVYDDGPGSSNLECTAQSTSSCWKHRANILVPLACTTCVMGAGFSTTDARNERLSMSVVLVETGAPGAVTFTWASESGGQQP